MNIDFIRKYGNHYKRILVVGFPILLGQLGVIITGFADTMMVGRYSTDALASASFVNSVINLMSIVCLGFSYGLTPLVGSYFARAETLKVATVVKTALLLNLLFTLLCAAILLVVYFFLDSMGQPSHLLPLMRPYYMVVLISMIPIGVVNALRQFTDGITDTKIAMLILVGGNVLNIVGNWVLIYGRCGFPELGLYGAGVSTLVARISMLVVYVGCLCAMKKYKPYVKAYTKGKITTKEMKQVVTVSMPVALQMGMETTIFTVAALFVGWLGAEYLAAYQVVLMVGTFGFMVYYSLGAGASILVANHAGVSDIVNVRRCAFAAYHVILAMALFASLLILTVGEDVMRWATSDERVIEISLTLIVPWIVYQLGDATQIAFANVLRGIKCVLPVMRYAFWSYIVLGIPACYIFAFPLNGGIVGVFLSFAVSLFVAGVLFMRRFHKETKNMCK